MRTGKWALLGALTGVISGIVVGVIIGIKVSNPDHSLILPLAANYALSLGLIGALVVGGMGLADGLLRTRRQRPDSRREK
jgi:hypothetical protein